MKKKWKYIKLLVLIAVSVFLFAFGQKRNAALRIKSIQVHYPEDEARFTHPDYVREILKKTDADLMKKPVSQIDVYALEKAVKEDEMIQNAEVYYDLKGVLHADIVEKTPIARILDGNRQYYMDDNGGEMPLSEVYSARVPVATGVSTEEDKQQLYALLTTLEEDDFLRKQVIGIRKENNGDYVLNTRIGKAKILLGNVHGLKDKLFKIKAFYRKIWGTDTMNLYKVISVKYRNQIIGIK